jgi:hypothetical protein
MHPSLTYDSSAVVKACFKTPEAKRAALRSYQSGPIEVFPGIMSNNPNFLRFKYEVAVHMSKNYPPTFDDAYRLIGDGIRGNFFGLLTLSGEKMHPATYPLYDNRPLRISKNLLPDTLTAPVEMMIRMFFRYVISKIEPQDINFNPNSSTVIPRFVSGRESSALKHAMFHSYVKEARRAAEAFKKKDFNTAFALDYIPCVFIVYRDQSTDKVSQDKGEFVAKPRMVNDLEYSLTDGKKGRRFEADKSLSWVDYPIPVPALAARTRTACGVNAFFNFLIAPVSQAMRTAIFREFPKTFHHTDYRQKEEKIKEFKTEVMAPVDLSDQDINFNVRKTQILCEELLRAGYEEYWVDMVRDSLHSALYLSAPAPNEGRCTIGDPRIPDLHPGMESGNQLTDILGYTNFADYAEVQLVHTAPHYLKMLSDESTAMQFVISYLNMELECGQMNKSDDALLLWTAMANMVKVHKLVKQLQEDKQVSENSLISYELGAGFLGDVFTYDKTYRVESGRFLPNIQSLFHNRFNPEYSCQSKIKDRLKVRHRAYGGLALKGVTDTYSRHPLYYDSLDVMEFYWQKHMSREGLGPSLKMFLQKWEKEDMSRLASDMDRLKIPVPDISSLTSIEIEVLDRFDKLAWKYPKESVRPEIAALATSVFDRKTSNAYLKSIGGPSDC